MTGSVSLQAFSQPPRFSFAFVETDLAAGGFSVMGRAVSEP